MDMIERDVRRYHSHPIEMLIMPGRPEVDWENRCLSSGIKDGILGALQTRVTELEIEAKYDKERFDMLGYARPLTTYETSVSDKIILSEFKNLEEKQESLKMRIKRLKTAIANIEHIPDCWAEGVMKDYKGI